MARYIGNPLTLGSIRAGGLVHMSAHERARHLYICGATRTGKSKLLEDLIRQDILAWPRSGCGMLVLDRHGSLFDNVMKWAAALDLSSWPIVPIDLRRSDYVVSYNPLRLRGRGEEDSVVVGNLLRSILHAWGQSNLNETPRLVKWLEATLTILQRNNLTLAEALQLIVSPAVRHTLTSHVEDFVVRSVWETVPRREADFQEMVESTVNRIRRFLSRRVMRATLGQNDVSLDLGDALDEGQIILACIATEGAKIDEEDASTIGSLLLSDTWMAAKARGKRDEGGVKPFYVYLDEFQEYVSPSIAETLDQASGFGLHMTFAHQFPSQLLKSHEGKQLYNSVLANCRNKVLFQLDHNEDLEALTLMLFRQEVNVMKVKKRIYATRVLDHRIEYLASHGTGTNQSVGGGTSIAHTTGESHTVGTSFSHTDGENLSLTETTGTSDTESFDYSDSSSRTDGSNTSRGRSFGSNESESDTVGTSWGESEGESSGTSLTRGSSWGRSHGRSHGGSTGTSTGTSKSVTFGPPHEKFQKEFDKLDVPNVSDADEAAFERKWGRSVTSGESSNESEGTSWNESDNESAGGSESRSEERGLSRQTSRGGSNAHGLTRGTSRGVDESKGTSLARTTGRSMSRGGSHADSESESLSYGISSSDTYGEDESWGTSTSETIGENTSWAEGTSQSVTWSPLLIPILGRELSSLTFERIDDQLFRFAQVIAGQPDRHCVIKLVSKPPVAVVTFTVKPARTTDEWTGEWATATVQALPFAVEMNHALASIEARHQELMHRIFEPQGEPTATGIPVDVNSLLKRGKGRGGNGNGKVC